VSFLVNVIKKQKQTVFGGYKGEKFNFTLNPAFCQAAVIRRYLDF